ncbi:MAG: CpsD/CapB family tyrosine-protein kinase [Terracidiphilus sp.]
MSKNFELMQELERAQEFQPVRISAAEIPFTSESNQFAEDFHWSGDETLGLVQRIFLLQTAKPPQVVVFAGIDHGNGCSGICRGVAETLAKHSSGPVCLLEANFRSPALPAMFGTTNHFGLTNALMQEAPIRSFAKRVGSDNLWLISSGSLAEDSPNLLTSERLKARLAELRAEFDFVIIDSPPLTRYTDAMALGHLTDGLVLVLEANSTRREAAQMAAATLRSSNIAILAAVLNKRTFPIPDSIYKRL